MLCGRRSPDGAPCAGEISVSLVPWEYYQEYYGGDSGISIIYDCKKCRRALEEEKIKFYELPTSAGELAKFVENIINGAEVPKQEK